MSTPIYDEERAINSLLYIACKVKNADIHKISKILYFADKEHLSKYGRTITGDTYIKMNYGPVPSNIYDILKNARNFVTNYDGLFQIKNRYYIEPLIDSDLDYLSKTDLQELDESIEKYGNLTFQQLTSLSHGIAWDSANTNAEIPIEEIMKEAEMDDEFIARICEDIDFEKSIC